MNIPELNEVRPSLINLDQSPNTEGCSSFKKIMKVVIPILAALGVAFGIGLPIVLSAPIVPIALLGAAAGVLGGIIVGLIVGLMLNRFFGHSSVKKAESQPATETQVSPLMVNSFYKQYMVGQEQHLEEIVESLSFRLGKNLNEVPHTEKELDQILEFIDQTKLALNRFDDLLKKVDDQSKLDLYLNEESIENKFNVADVLKPLTENQQRDRREALQKVINQAFINRELKQKGKLTNGDENEKQLLKNLGYDVNNKNSNYGDKDLIYGVLKNIVENQLKNESYAGPLNLFKQSLKLCALKARLNAAGVNTPLQIEKFQNTMEKYIELKAELTELIKDVNLVLPENFEIKKDSVLVQSLEERFKFKKLTNRRIALNIFFQTIKDQFHNENFSSKVLKDLIDETHNDKLPREELLKRCQNWDGSLTSYIEHYVKWGKYFQAGLIQGFGDDNEILGDGVCAGFCQRLVFKAQQDPDISPEKLSEEVHITSRDRFFQATLGARWDKLNGKSPKAPQMIEKQGYEEKVINRFIYDPTEPVLESIFSKLGNTLAPSAGWVSMDLQGAHGHAILTRWDTERNCYWVLDPNEGLVCFENPQASHQEAQKLCLDYLKDLFELHYKWLTHIFLIQLIKSPDLVADKMMS